MVIACVEQIDKILFEPYLAAGLFPNNYKTKVHLLSELQREINLLKDFAAFFQILDLIIKIKPHVVHTHTSKAGILGRWSAFLYNCFYFKGKKRIRIIHTPHGHVFYGYFAPVKTMIFTLLERITAKITDRLVALTSGELEESVSRGVGAKQQWTIIHSGIDMGSCHASSGRAKIRAGLGIPESALIAGVVARLEPIKGVEYFVRGAVETAASMPDKDIRFIIVGDGSQRQMLENMAEKSGIKEKIYFTGYKSNVLDYMAAMDVYVQPSINEGMGQTLVQASFCGLPIVAAKVCGIPDVVKHGVTGILVPPGDYTAVAEAVIMLFKDASARSRLGSNGKTFVLENDETGFPRFSCCAMNSKLEKLYTETVEGRR